MTPKFKFSLDENNPRLVVVVETVTALIYFLQAGKYILFSQCHSALHRVILAVSDIILFLF